MQRDSPNACQSVEGLHDAPALPLPPPKPPPTPPPVNGEKEASEGVSVRAEEIDPPPRERDARADAANGEIRPPPIPP